jgi:hypothetical protein
MNLRSELTQAQQYVVQNQTATVLDLGSNLLNQTTAQTRRLTDVEAQVRWVSGRPGWLTAQTILPWPLSLREVKASLGPLAPSLPSLRTPSRNYLPPGYKTWAFYLCKCCAWHRGRGVISPHIVGRVLMY